MGKPLEEIAQKLRNSDKRVQLIYAFNGVGKPDCRVLSKS